MKNDICKDYCIFDFHGNTKRIDIRRNLANNNSSGVLSVLRRTVMAEQIIIPEKITKIYNIMPLLSSLLIHFTRQYTILRLVDRQRVICCIRVCVYFYLTSEVLELNGLSTNFHCRSPNLLTYNPNVEKFGISRIQYTAKMSVIL